MNGALKIAALATALLVAGSLSAAFSPPAQLTVVTDINYPPYLFRTEDGKVQGILKDKWALWSERTGIPVLVEGMEWSAAQQSVQSGAADVIEALSYTEARTRLYEFSPPYAPMEARVYFHRTISGINDVASMSGFAIGAKQGSACAAWLEERGIKTLRGYATSEELIRAAGDGEVRLFCMDTTAAEYFLFKHGLADEFRQTPPLYTTRFHWAVRKGRTELRDFIQRGFDRIRPEELREIDARWIGNPLKFPLDPRYLYYLAVAIATVLGAGAFLALWNRALRLRVAARTAEVLRLNAELERRIAERTAQLTLANAELRAANEQLESFSYSVSHDLRAPLRHIDGFAQLLREQAQGLDAKSREYLETISKSASWMGRLIDDLLMFARTTRAQFHPARVELSPLVQSARDQCLRDAGDRRIEWHIAPLPAVEGDRSLLLVAFVNLLSNAIKFTARRENAVVEVGSWETKTGEVVVFVKDNGAGFDMRYAHKLFGVFQRIHAQEEFEGTGVGLATVQRIVTRHGGRIWAESAPDAGATFYVALKAAREASGQPS
ncbi:MAG TPA: transporter substrate-binding domain-containing protein [Burkholderiales bacterium]|nr:transporter substrate-binding domain-containing protein [Burkholderiales bacterium]